MLFFCITEKEEKEINREGRRDRGAGYLDVSKCLWVSEVSILVSSSVLLHPFCI